MSAIGDVILSVPSLRAIRLKYKAANIKVLVGVSGRQILDKCPYINDIIVCDFKGRDRGIRGLMSIARELQKNCFDIVIDLQNNRRSHILSLLCLAPLRYGYANGKYSFLLNKRIKDDAPYLGPIEHQFRILKLAGVKPEDKRLELWSSESDEEKVSSFLKDNWVKPGQRLVGINVRASGRWLTKNWPAPYIAELCDKLARESGVRVVLTGAKEDSGAADEVRSLAKSKPIVAAGKTDIMELACLIRGFNVYLTPGAAPMHVSAAVGVPFVALFGPTDPARHIPPAKDYVVIYKDEEVTCAPCYSPNCLKKIKCMKRITVDEVFGVIKELLSRDEG